MKKAIIGKKIGMTQIFDENGKVVPVTVVEAGPCVVVQKKTIEKDGYEAIQVGFGEIREKLVNKPRKGHFAKAGVSLRRTLKEFRLEDCSAYEVGQEIKADLFVAGDKIDVSGVSKGKGFQGAMKRHNFGGKEATHGVLKAHRSIGGTGMREWPGRVLKGKKMAGQMGNETVSVQNLKVFGVDTAENLIFVEGAVPGANGTFVLVTDAIKKEQKDLPIPTMAAAQNADAGTEQVTETETAAVAE